MNICVPPTSINQPRLAEGFDHHGFGRHAAGVRVAASAEAVVVEAARFGIDIQPVNPNGGAAKITMPHRLFFGGNILNADGLRNLVLRQNLPQTCDRTRSVGSTTGFQNHEGGIRGRRERTGARSSPDNQHNREHNIVQKTNHGESITQINREENPRERKAPKAPSILA